MYRQKDFELPVSAPTAPGYSADLAGLIAFLKTREPNQEYDAGRPDECLAAQFFARSVGASLTPEFGGDGRINAIAFVKPSTFGDALRRALAANGGEGK